MLLPHNAPQGCFASVNILKQRWVESYIVDGKCVFVVVMFQSWLGSCPTLSKFMVLGYVMGSPHHQSVRDLVWVCASTITYKFLQIMVSTTIYIFVQSIFTWKLNLAIYVHVQKLIVSKHCVFQLFTKESL